MEIDNIAGDALDPGVEGIDTALAYIEGTLQSTANIADKLLRSTVTSNEDKAKFLNDWREKRAIRDALYQEKQKRAEQPVKPSGMTEEEIERSRKRLEELMSKKEANAPAPPGEVTQTPESERRSENPQDTKIKFGTVLQSFVRQFGDGTVTELFRAFVRNDPTSQQYDAAATKLSGLYGKYMRDQRFPSDKIPEFRDEVRDIAELLNPDRLRFNDALSQLQSDLGNPEGYSTIAHAFESQYGDGAKPTSEQWKTAAGKMNQLMTEYRKDKRSRGEKSAEWLEKIKMLSRSL